MRWLILLVLLVPTWADAAEWYVRAAGGSYGTEDGSSYANAYDGFTDITWGVGGVESGDTLYLCGTHRQTLTVQTSTVTVSLACQDDIGKIYGSDADDGTTGWSGPNGNGNYYKTYTTRPRVVARDPSVSDAGTVGTILLKGTAEATLQAGEFIWSANVLYIHENPSGHTYEVGQRDRAITFPNSAIADLTVTGGETPCSVDQTVDCGQILFSNFRGIADADDAWTNDRNTLTVTNVYFFGIREQCVHQDNSSTAQFDSIIVSGIAVLENGGEGVYVNNLRSAGLVAVRNSLFGSADWDNYGWDGAAGSYTGDGIDVNPADTFGNFEVEISGNTITNLRGDGIVFTGGNARIFNNTITDSTSMMNADDNDIHAVILQPGTTGTTGIVFYGNTITLSTRLGNGIKACGASAANTPMQYVGNVVTIADTTRWNVVQQTCNKTGNHKWANNTFIGGLSGLYTNKTFSLAGGYIKNTIFYGQQYPINMANTTISDWTASGNVMVPLTTQANPYAFNTATYASIAALDAGQASWDANSAADPLFVGATDFRTQGTSTLRRAGVIGFSCADPRGRPCWTPPDIGAYQSSSGDPAGPRAARQ